jgi:hypothetical protein
MLTPENDHFVDLALKAKCVPVFGAQKIPPSSIAAFKWPVRCLVPRRACYTAVAAAV